LRTDPTTRRALAVALAACALLAAGCRQNMHNQAKVEPLETSDFFADGQGARMLPAHTVARGDLRADVGLYTGIGADQQPLTTLPFPVTREVLRRGEERYNVFCAPCHDRVGSGRGMIVQRGYKQPTSYHDPRLRSSPVGYFFNVMTDGFGVMPSYASQIPVEDRWAIAAWIRVLQYSQNASLAGPAPAGPAGAATPPGTPSHAAGSTSAAGSDTAEGSH
jgi:Cytochrome C oxidase, cbb3-type, subunit III